MLEPSASAPMTAACLACRRTFAITTTLLFHGFVENLNAVSTLVMAFFTALAAFFIYRQFKVTHDAERTWLAIKSVGNPPEGWVNTVEKGHIPGVVFEFAAYGKTVVRVVDARFALRIVPAKTAGTGQPDLPIPPDYTITRQYNIGGGSGMLVPPSGTFQISCFLDPTHTTEAQLNELIRGSTLMCAYGFVRYKDAFGKVRETRVCYTYDFAFGGILRTPEGSVINRVGFHPDGPPEYNSAT